MRPAWFPDWSSDVCALIASGPSINVEEVELLKGRCRVAVVNNGHELAPWADLLYAADVKWWDCYKTEASSFAGMKVTPDSVAAKRYKIHEVQLIGDIDTDSDRIDVSELGRISRGGNSAFQLVNLVTQFGVKRQIWIGFDFVGEHWHVAHPHPLKNPRAFTLEKWRRRLDAQASVLAGLGVEVINCSSISALENYERMTVEAALTRFCRG